jgi:hypothetical protein
MEKKPTKRSRRIPTATIVTGPEPTREAVAQRAFELFMSRGCEHGHALEDWIRAEEELRATG